MNQLECQCEETHLTVLDENDKVVSRTKLRGAARHSCDYIRERNSLIPAAERAATAYVCRLSDRIDGDPKKDIRWSTRFMEVMNDLWAGRRKEIAGG